MCGRKRSWPKFEVMSGLMPEWTVKIIEKPPDRGVNRGPPEYEAGVPTSQPRRSIT
jgi:hypothetical protein